VRNHLTPVAAALGALTFGALFARGAQPLAGAEAVPAAAPAGTLATGRIEGTVTISTVLAERRPRFRPYSDPGTGNVPPAPPADPVAAELHNVVIYMDGDSTVLPAPPDVVEAHRHGAIAQRDEQFVPHVVAVMVGATVDFPNDDDVYHNVFSLSSAKTFDLGRYPKGSSKSELFARPGTVQVFCHIHSDMSAIVLVLPNPYFASPADDRHFVIDGVPEGDYTIVGWHERIKPITRRIHVTAGQTVTADFNIPLPQGGPSR
jgi:plastocyanin